MNRTAKKVTKIEPVNTAQAIGKAREKRVCAYCRVSTDSEDQKNSFEAQVDYYRHMIGKRSGWTFAGIYADEARSGTKVKCRDEFQRMVRDCERGKIDYIITKSLTRFARNTVDSLKTIRKLKNMGIGIYFEKERIDTLAEKSELLITILSSVAQGESESISTNIKWSVLRRFQNGTFVISDPAYGYQNDEEGNLIIEPEEAMVVRRIFEDYLGGKGAYVIAQELETEKVPTIRCAKTWRESSVRGILNNPIYEGDVLQQKTYTTAGVPFIRKSNKGELSQYLIRDNHEPIISREEAEMARKICAYRKEKKSVDDPSVYQKRYAFSSKIICGDCGGTFRRQKLCIGKPNEKVQWSCHNHILNRDFCSQKAIREETLKGLFVQMWNRLAGNYEKILVPVLAGLKAIPKDLRQEEEILELNNQIDELKQQSYMLRKILVDGDIGSAVFIEKRNLLDSELNELRRRLHRLEWETVFENEIVQTEYLITIFRNRPSIMESYDEEAFLLLVDHVTVYPEKQVRFCLKNGLELEEWIEEGD